MRSIKNVMEECHYLIERYKVNDLGLQDDMFVTSKARLAEFCEAFKETGLSWSCQARVTNVNDEIAALLKASGCHHLSLGFESGSPRVLKSMKKGITPEFIERAIRACLKAKLTIQGNFIFGDPAETLETMEETIGFTRRFGNLSIGFGLIIPYPGSDIYHQLIADGRLTDRLGFYENPQHKFYNMTVLPDVDFQYMCKKVCIEYWRRRSRALGEVTKAKRLGNGEVSFDIRCHHCHGLNEDCRLDFNVGQFIVCRHCYQRTCISPVDLRFRSISGVVKEAVFFLFLDVITISPKIFRITYPLIQLAKMVRRRLRGSFGGSIRASGGHAEATGS
jgi:anaerobic magnesium-protoporphyrin IX monomethyl ester cyclase